METNNDQSKHEGRGKEGFDFDLAKELAKLDEYLSTGCPRARMRRWEQER